MLTVSKAKQGKRRKNRLRSGHSYGLGMDPTGLFLFLGLAAFFFIFLPCYLIFKALCMLLGVRKEENEDSLLYAPLSKTLGLSSPKKSIEPTLPKIRDYKKCMPLVDEVRLKETIDYEGTRCPVCGDEITEDFTTCPRCEVPHHRDCWEFSRGCAVYGCKKSPKKKEPDLGFEELSTRLDRWFCLERLKWWIELAFWSVLSLSFGCFRVYHDIRDLSGFFLKLALLALIGYALLWTVVNFFRCRLEKSLGTPVAAPPNRAKKVIEIVSKSKSRPILEQAAEVFPFLYLLLATIALFTSQSSPRMFTPFFFFIWGFLAAFIVPWISKRHRRRLEIVRWRLHARLKSER